MANIFIVSLTYTVPIDEIDALLAPHLEWLKAGHSAGKFLAWGPKEPRDGGLIFVRAKDRAEAESLVSTDPFMIAGAATNEIIEWAPRFLGPGLEAFGG